MNYFPNKERYNDMLYNRCGQSGLKLPAISYGLWHNFGECDYFDNSRKLIHSAFDMGITHFDLANNYGPPPGSAEETFGRILKKDLNHYRDELIISTKAGYYMWPGPYGDWGSKKYLIASINQSLNRMGLEYVDIFYHHRPDPNTPIEETMLALDQIVKQGKALYIGLSNYNDIETKEAVTILKELGTPLLIHQASYSMLNRSMEDNLQSVLKDEGIGCIAFVPLAQGLLTNRYLNGIPDDSRAAKPTGFLSKESITEEIISKIKKLNTIAENRNQSLAQMAIAWVLKNEQISSVLIGASQVAQIKENVKALENVSFSQEELNLIDKILKDHGS
ncbi:L-glyceraldehyde 3-phosphate reductase [Solibacillus daqui]|uniref:L-glyceraldehyde 3-phosphate reductase n=1 Tax=Solibacillus daqui TaxID=2912187 RepID=UPI002366AC5B|nr:L-glyceraldehyde 3-phosphate reductase [Solibacillus daqui]